MVRKRKSLKQEIEVSEEQIDAFANNYDKKPGELRKELNPKAPRNYKSITLKLNQYEYERLAKAAMREDRGTLDFIRQAIKAAVDKQ